MIKQTLMFTNPVSLSLKDQQMVITFKDNKDTVTRPIEDLGFVIIENPMVSITIPLLNELANHSVSVVFCDKKQMLQYSVYIRHCASKESQTVHVKRVKSIVPETGMVSMLSVTDKQYGDIINFWGKEKKKKVPTEPLQLEIF